jgi:hypothetical protein
VARSDLHRLLPLLEVIWELLQKGLIGEEILRTFLSHGVQLLHQWETVVRVSSGLSHLVRPSFTRASNARINTQVADALFPGDLVRWEAHHACSKWL